MLLALLRTCEQAYAEGIETLDRNNSFCFQDCTSLQTFATVTPLYHLTSIVTIHFPWLETYLNWMSVNNETHLIWDALGRMTSLREIRVIPRLDQNRFPPEVVKAARIRNGWVQPPWMHWISLLRKKSSARIVDSHCGP